MTKIVETSMQFIGARQLPKAIKALHADGRAWQEQAHLIACSILKHLGRTGDIRHTEALLKDMPEAMRVNSLKMWLEAFGPVRFPDKDERAGGAPEIMHVKGKKTQMGEAMAKPFWKFKALEGKPYEAIDLNAKLEQLIKALQKDATQTGTNWSAQITALKTLEVTPAKVEKAVDDTAQRAQAIADANAKLLATAATVQ